MHGFSFINRTGPASVHMSTNGTFDAEDAEELRLFVNEGHSVVETDLLEKDAQGAALEILCQLAGDAELSPAFWANFVDTLSAECNSRSGLLIVVSAIGDGMLGTAAIVIIEYFLMCIDSWIDGGKPLHLVLCDRETKSRVINILGLR